MTYKSTKPPAYFLETKKVTDKIEQEMADILGVSVEWMKQRAKQGKQPFIPTEMLTKLCRGKTDKLQLLISIASDLKSGMWAKFRWENIDNEYGSAAVLNFNKDKERIEIRRDPFKRAREAVKKAFQEVGISRN